MPTHRIALASCVLACFATAQTHVLPNGFATLEGNHLNNIPWGTGGGARAQFLYDSTHFTNANPPITQPIVITQLRWRANGSATVTWTGGTYSQARVEMSTAATDFASPSATFAQNHGQDRTTVVNGPVTMNPQPVGYGIPGPWYVDTPLTTSFFYDPTSGSDLVMDIDVPGGTWSGGTRSIMDYHQGGTTGASRVSASLTYPAPTGTIAVNECAVVELTYAPATGLFPRFTASAVTGNSPLQVQFTDNSFSTAPGGVTAWLWDFENDGIVDSNLQNPVHTYTTCGTRSVRLAVLDSVNGLQAIVKTNFITLDAITVGFSGLPLAGLAPAFVQFTDISTGPITSWAWDFDNNSIVDSTQQNPLWVFATPGSYDVRLTVTSACFSETLLRTGYVVVLDPNALPAPPDLLQYQFNEVRGQELANTATTATLPSQGAVNTANWQGDPGRANFHGNEPGAGMLADTQGVGSTNLVNVGGTLTVNGSMTVMWWQRQTGTPPSTAYVCGNSGPYIYTGGGTAGQRLLYRALASIGDVFSTTTIHTSMGIWRHVALVVDNAAGVATWYFDGIADPPRPFTPNTHNVSFAPFHIGYGSNATVNSSFTRFWALDDFRIYGRALSAGEIAAAIIMAENASAGAFGASCPGPGGTPVIGATGIPNVGNLGFQVTLANAEDLRLAGLVMGLAPRAFGTFDLSPYLGTGCRLEVDWFSAAFSVTSGGASMQPVGIPNNSTFRGLHVYCQWLIAGSTGAVTRAIDLNIE